MSSKTQSETKTKIKLQESIAENKNIVFHNDNTTSMDFVMMLLVNHLEHPPEKAFELMMKVHEGGQAIVKTAPKTYAELLYNGIKKEVSNSPYSEFKVSIE